MCYCSNTGGTDTKIRVSTEKLTPEKKILLPLLRGFKPTTFQSGAWHSNRWAIPAPHMSVPRQAEQDTYQQRGLVRHSLPAQLVRHLLQLTQHVTILLNLGAQRRILLPQHADLETLLLQFVCRHQKSTDCTGVNHGVAFHWTMKTKVTELWKLKVTERWKLKVTEQWKLKVTERWKLKVTERWKLKVTEQWKLKVTEQRKLKVLVNITPPTTTKKQQQHNHIVSLFIFKAGGGKQKRKQKNLGNNHF